MKWEVSKVASEEFVVTGKIIFDNISKPFKNAILTVKLDDVSKQDAPSETIAEQTIKNLDITEKEVKTKEYPQIDFTLHGSISNSKGLYIVSVLLDVDRDGRMGVGDYITMEFYPVLTRGNPKFVKVHVKEIR